MLLRPFEELTRYAVGRRGVMSRTIETSVGVHHLYEARAGGRLPTIVLLHGIGAGATGFARLMVELAPHTRRLLAPDAPGHGFSGRPNRRLDPKTYFASMKELLDRELDEPAIVFGNSLGGAAALAYARDSKEKVRGLILCSPAGAPMEDDALRRMISSFRMRTRRDAYAFMRRLYHRPPWYIALVAGDVRAIFASQPIRDILDSVTAADAVPADELRALEKPLLFIWGKSEKLMPPEHLAWYKQHLPRHAEVLEPDDFGHCPHLDRPREVARTIVEFVRSRAA